MLIGFILQQYQELNESTTRGLTTYTRGLLQSLIAENIDNTELHFGEININATMIGSSSSSSTSTSSCTIENLDIATITNPLNCIVADVIDEPDSCFVSWKCSNVPVNVSGTIDVRIPNIPAQWQGFLWEVDAISRSIRNETRRENQRHKTVLQGMIVPVRNKILCGESIVNLKLTRGFSIIRLENDYSQTAGVQLGAESTIRGQCEATEAPPKVFHSIVFKFGISENIQVDRTNTLLSISARASLTLSLFVSALAVSIQAKERASRMEAL